MARVVTARRGTSLPALGAMAVALALAMGQARAANPPITGTTPLSALNGGGGTFDGGTLVFDQTSPGYAAPFTISPLGGTIDTNGNSVYFTGTLTDTNSADPGDLHVINSGSGGFVRMAPDWWRPGANLLIDDGATVQLDHGYNTQGTITIRRGTLGLIDPTNLVLGPVFVDGGATIRALPLSAYYITNVPLGPISGTGPLVLSGYSSVLGGYSSTVLELPSVQIDGDFTVDGGRVQVAQGGLFDVSGRVSILGNGKLSLDAHHAFTSPLTLQTPDFAYDVSTLELRGGDVRLTSDVTVLGKYSLITSDGALTLDGGVSGTGGIRFQANKIILNGVLSQTGGMYGTGEIWLLGNNTFSGGFNWVVGAVHLVSDAGLGAASNNITIGTLMVDASFATDRTIHTGAGRYGGGSTFTMPEGVTLTTNGLVGDGFTDARWFIEKNGAGNWVSNGEVLAGRLSINEGTAIMNGLTMFRELDVAPGARLAGSGGYVVDRNGLAAATIVGGTLAPGNGIGAMTTQSSVTMQPGSTFETTLAGTGTGSGAGSYSRLVVQGAGATFTAGGTVVPLLASSSGVAYTPSMGDTYRIVTADGGVIGTFDALVQPLGLAPGTRFRFDYSHANWVDLVVVASTYSQFLAPGVSRNTQAAAAAVDRAITAADAGQSTPAGDALIGALGATDTGRFASYARALSGEVYAQQQAMQYRATFDVVNDVDGHLQATPLADTAGGHGPLLWATGSHDNYRASSDAHGSGYEGQQNRLSAGADLYRSESISWGMGVTHADISLDGARPSDKIRSNGVLVYGEAKAGMALIDGTGYLGTQRWTTQRLAPLGSGSSLDARAGGQSTMVSLAVRVPLQAGPVRVEPYVSLAWQRQQRDAFVEQGTNPAALSVAGYGATGVRGVVGARITSLQANPLDGTVTYRVGVGFGVDHGDALRGETDAALVGQTFRTTAPYARRTFGRVDASGTLRVGGMTYLYAGVDAESGRGRAGYGASVGIRMAF